MHNGSGEAYQMSAARLDEQPAAVVVPVVRRPQDSGSQPARPGANLTAEERRLIESAWEDYYQC